MSFRSRNKSKSGSASGAGFRDKSSSKVGRVFMCLFGFPFFAMGAAFCWFMAIQPILLSVESRSWPQVECVITTSQVERNTSSDGDTYKVHIEFEYEFNAEQYTGGSYDFSDVSSSGRKSKQKIVSRYPVGSEEECWVNPEEPSIAVLSNGIPGIVFFIIPFTSVFMLIGLAIILSSLGLLPKKWKNKVHSNHEPVDTSDKGEALLKPKSSGWGKVIGSLAVAAFWNGIVSVFLWQVVQGFQRDKPEWFLVIFLIPFVLVGLGMIVAVFYYLCALANPSLSLRMTEARPRLGQEVELTWESTKSLQCLKSLKIILEGRESATYRRGTNSVTDHCSFYRSTVFETEEPSSHTTGSIHIEIPSDSMHSFDGGNNKIEWKLRVEGDIHRWPDVKEEYPLTIRPKKLT